MSSPNTEVRRKRKKTPGRVTRDVHHSWTNQEDAVLVRCLHVMADDPKWKRDNGTFRLVPQSIGENVGEITSWIKHKAGLHIESRIKLLKMQYNVICEMITTRSGFRLNDQKKCVTVSKDVFDGWVKVSPKFEE